MRVSTRVEYGMLALTDIALHSENGSTVSGPEIAERQEISQKYLEQILTHLKQAGLIRAQKGLRGGYTLARPADQIIGDFQRVGQQHPGRNGSGRRYGRTKPA